MPVLILSQTNPADTTTVCPSLKACLNEAIQSGMEEGKRGACRQEGASGEFFKWHTFSSIKPAASWRVLD